MSSELESAAFAFQRSMLDAGRTMAVSSIDLQTNLAESGNRLLATQGELQQQAIAQGTEFAEAMIGAGNASAPGEPFGAFESVVEESGQFVREQNADAFSIAENVGAETLEQKRALDEVAIEAIHAQTDMLLEANEELESRWQDLRTRFDR